MTNNLILASNNHGMEVMYVCNVCNHKASLFGSIYFFYWVLPGGSDSQELPAMWRPVFKLLGQKTLRRS